MSGEMMRLHGVTWLCPHCEKPLDVTFARWNRMADRMEEIAKEAESWCKNSMTHHEWCGCSIARKLRGE